MANNWFCLVIGATSCHGNTDKVVSEIAATIQNNASSILVVNSSDIMNTGEYFIFIDGKNAMKKKEELLRLSCVSRIISTGETPYAFSDSEVDSFRSSIIKKDNSVSFKRGDVVFVKEGRFKNLFGLVLGKKDDDIKVLFKFHVRNFIEEMEPKVLRKDKNVFDFQPSNIDKKDWFKKFTE